MANVSNFSASTPGASVAGTLTDKQVVAPVAPTGLRAEGPRVTFHFAGNWDAGNTYVYYDVVKDNSGASWICKHPQVPAGTPLEEGTYWTRWADPNLEVEELYQTVQIYDARITKNTNNIEDIKNNAIFYTHGDVQEFINTATESKRIAFFDKIETDTTIIINENTMLFIGQLIYTGNDCAIKYIGGTNSRIEINELSSTAVGIDMSRNMYMDGGYVYIGNATCQEEVIKYTPLGESVSWCQYLKINGNTWHSEKTNVITAKTVSTTANTQWANNVTISGINFSCNNPNYGIELINRDYSADLFGFDCWKLDNISFEKCYRGFHGYSITGLKSSNIRVEETTNYALVISGFCTDCVFEISGFLKTNENMPFILSNVETKTCIVKAPIYTDISYKNNPIYTEIQCGKNVLIPLKSVLTEFNSTSEDYTAPTDFSKQLPTYFQLADNKTINLGDMFYGKNKIHEVYLYGFSDTYNNCKVIVNGVSTTITKQGIYAITTNNNLLKIS